MEMNKEEMLAQLEEALEKAQDDQAQINFVSDTDQGDFFPAEVEGGSGKGSWRIVRRQSQLVPKHYANHATYQRVVKQKVEANEEAQSSDTSVGS